MCVYVIVCLYVCLFVCVCVCVCDCLNNNCISGRTTEELPDVKKQEFISNETNYVDVYPMIWKEFMQSGYVTLFAEDMPQYGTFQLRLNGFQQIPVDHYMRPFWMAAGNSTLKRFFALAVNQVIDTSPLT